MTQEELSKALVHHQAGERAQAARMYEHVLEADPDNADAWHLLGVIAHQEGRPEAAVGSVKRAINLNPSAPAFHHNLGNIYATMGEIESARACFLEAIELNPNFAEAYFGLVNITQFEPGNLVIQRIEANLHKSGSADGDLAKEIDRCRLHFAAGKIYDDMRDYDKSFMHYRAANETKDAAYDNQARTQFVDSLIDVFGSSYFVSRWQCGISTTVPIFIVGMPRTGTSLVEQILASHPQCYGAGELYYMYETINELAERSQNNGEGFPRYMAGVSDEDLQFVAELHLRRLNALAPGNKHIIDKAPINFERLGLIHSMFPNAKIIHCVRNPLDTLLSCYFQNFNSRQDYSYSMENLAAYYQQYLRLMKHWEQVLSAKILTFDYESLIFNQRQITRRLLDFCDLQWHEGCLDFQLNTRRIYTASDWQVRQPLYTRAVGRWRNYEKYLTPLMNALGYPTPSSDSE